MAARLISILTLLSLRITAQTPAPTDPSTSICETTPIRVTGDYNDDMITFPVNVVENNGDLTIDATLSVLTNGGSDASDLMAIEVLFPDGSTLVSDGDSDPGGYSDACVNDYALLCVENIPNGTYEVYFFVGPGFPPPTNSFGTFDITFTCATNAPSTSPTLDPTFEPTFDPTMEPTPTSVTDGDTVSGDYESHAVLFSVYVDSACDATFDASASDLEGITLSVADSGGSVVASGNETVTVSSLPAGTYTVSLEADAGETGSFEFSFICDGDSGSSDSSDSDSIDVTGVSGDSESDSIEVTDNDSGNSDDDSGDSGDSGDSDSFYVTDPSDDSGSGESDGGDDSDDSDSESISVTSFGGDSGDDSESGDSDSTSISVTGAGSSDDDENSGGSDSGDSDSSDSSPSRAPTTRPTYEPTVSYLLQHTTNTRTGNAGNALINRELSANSNSGSSDSGSGIDSSSGSFALFHKKNGFRDVLQSQINAMNGEGDDEIQIVEIDPDPATLATVWVALIAVMCCVSAICLYCVNHKEELSVCNCI